jgi:hypothetical protein
MLTLILPVNNASLKRTAVILYTVVFTGRTNKIANHQILAYCVMRSLLFWDVMQYRLAVRY